MTSESEQAIKQIPPDDQWLAEALARDVRQMALDANSELKTSVDSIKGALTLYSNDLHNVRQQIDALMPNQKSKNELQERIGSIKEFLENQKISLDRLANTVEGTNTHIREKANLVETTTNGLTTAVDSLNTSLDRLTDDLKSMSDKVDAVSEFAKKIHAAPSIVSTPNESNLVGDLKTASNNGSAVSKPAKEIRAVPSVASASNVGVQDATQPIGQIGRNQLPLALLGVMVAALFGSMSGTILTGKVVSADTASAAPKSDPTKPSPPLATAAATAPAAAAAPPAAPLRDLRAKVLSTLLATLVKPDLRISMNKCALKTAEEKTLFTCVFSTDITDSFLDEMGQFRLPKDNALTKPEASAVLQAVAKLVVRGKLSNDMDVDGVMGKTSKEVIETNPCLKNALQLLTNAKIEDATLGALNCLVPEPAPARP